MSELRLYLFGAPRLERDGQPIAVESRKALALLAYLAVTQHTHSRDTIATLFWPDLDHTGARATLRSTLWMLKKVCGEWVEAERETVALKGDVGAQIDVVVFERMLATCRTHGHPENVPCPECLPVLDAATELYKGDFLEGFTLRDSSSFEDWQILNSENLRHQLAQALECLTKYHEAQGAFDTALRPARRWLALDPLHEPAHQALMRLYAQAGQPQNALRQYDFCCQALEKELGVSPQPATQELYRAIQENRLPAHLGKSAPPKGNLSAHMPPTSFVGRETDLAEIAARLENSVCRLLTISGPGGIGKTRVALQAAWQMAERPLLYPDGVFFVPLAGVQSPDFLISAIVTALRLPLSGPTDPKTQLLNYLREKHMLLVLDNFEQLVEGKELLHDILTHAREVKLLVTSRERLILADEWLYEIPGLTYPRHEGVETFEGFSSVELFLQRAQRRHSIPSFWEREKQGIVRICQLVQGMPLGVELAATWVRGLSCQEIAHELERNLDRLSTTHQNLPDRHRNMRAVFDQSWACLTDAEKSAFCKLSVFRGGFRREAAEQVANVPLLVLMSLADKSFLSRAANGRYEIHELLRQYGEGKLWLQPEEQQSTQSNHGSYYAVFLEQRRLAFRGAKQLKASEEIAEEIDNVHTAWHWAITQDRWDLIASSLESLFIYYERRALFREGREAFRQAVESLQAAKDIPGVLNTKRQITLGQALVRHGMFNYYLDYYPAAEELLNAGLSMLRSLGAQSDIAYALVILGNLTRDREDFAHAKQLYQESLDLYTELTDQWGRASSLAGLGTVAILFKDYETAQGLLNECYAIRQELEDRIGIIGGLHNLGIVASRVGDANRAQSLLKQSLALAEEDHLGTWIASCLFNLGMNSYRSKEYLEAIRYHLECIRIDKELGYRDRLTYSLCWCAQAALELGEIQETKHYLQEALKTALALEEVWRVLDVLNGTAETWATVWASEGNSERVIELLVFLRHYPASSQEIQSAAEKSLANLEKDFTVEVIAAAREKGQARTLESIVKEILEEPGTISPI